MIFEVLVSRNAKREYLGRTQVSEWLAYGGWLHSEALALLWLAHVSCSRNHVIYIVA